MAMTYVWLTFLGSLILWSDEVAISIIKKLPYRVSRKLNLFVDFGAIGVMVWAGWVFMPMLYAFSLIGASQLHSEKLIQQAATNAA